MKRECGSWTIVRSLSIQVFTAYTLDLNLKKNPLKRDKSTMFHNEKNELLEPVRGKQN